MNADAEIVDGWGNRGFAQDAADLIHDGAPQALQLLGGPGLSCDLGPGGGSSPTFPNPVQAFCDDAYAAICGDTSQEEPASRDYSAIFREARGITGRRYGFSNSMKGISRYMDAHPEQKSELIDHLIDARRRRVLARLEPLGAGTIPRAAYSVIRGMVSALNSPESSLALEALGRLRVPDPIEFLRGGPADPAIRSLMRSRCGTDGMTINAFKPPGRDLIIICPGYLIYEGMGLARFRPRLMAHLSQVVAHEASHAIDAHSAPDLNRVALSCLSGLLDQREPAHHRNREKDVDELIADHWAAEAIGDIMRRQTTRQDAAEYLRRGAVGMCRFENDKGDSHASDQPHSHPPARFRLRTIFGQNPAIRRALGCSDSEAWPNACPDR